MPVAVLLCSATIQYFIRRAAGSTLSCPNAVVVIENMNPIGSELVRPRAQLSQRPIREIGNCARGARGDKKRERGRGDEKCRRAYLGRTLCRWEG